MNSKIITIFSIIFIVSGLGILAYVFFVPQEKVNNINTPLFPTGEDRDPGDTQNGGIFDSFFDTDNTTDSVSTSKLKQIFPSHVSGYTILNNNVVRIVERGSGHVFDYIEGETTKISNKTMLGIENVAWSKDAEMFITQSENDLGGVDTILYSFGTESDKTKNLFTFNNPLSFGDSNTDVRFLQITLNADGDTQISTSGVGSPGKETNYYGDLTKNAVMKFQKKYNVSVDGIVSENTLSELNIVNNELFSKKDNDITETELISRDLGDVGEITINSNTGSLFYLAKDGIGVSGIVSDIELSSKKQVFSSPINSWVPSWVGNSTIALQTKASGRSPGFLYLISGEGTPTKILGDIYGLITNTNPTGEYVIFSDFSKNGRTPLFNVYNRSNNKIKTLDATTIPEKCTWGKFNANIVFCAVPNEIPSVLMPDSWYQGKVSFNDSIWLFNIETSENSLLLEGSDFDITHLLLDDMEETLYFIDKKDSSLWSFSLR